MKPAHAAFLCSLVIVTQYATAADSRWAGAMEIKARWAPAIAVALREFQAHQGTKTDKGEPVYGDLRHYTIEMIPRGEILSVTFAPDMGSKDWRDHTLGGRTQYGIAVNYDVSLKTLKVVKTSWFR